METKTDYLGWIVALVMVAAIVAMMVATMTHDSASLRNASCVAPTIQLDGAY